MKSYLKMGINFAFSNSRQKLTVSDESLIRTALLQSPSVAVRNAEAHLTDRIRTNGYKRIRWVLP